LGFQLCEYQLTNHRGVEAVVSRGEADDYRLLASGRKVPKNSNFSRLQKSSYCTKKNLGFDGFGQDRIDA
jgi:hypothetical protein